jgi:hypothetical protein
LLSLKLPHSILCNTGLARARRKLLAEISFEDALRDARNVKICPTFSETEIQSAKSELLTGKPRQRLEVSPRPPIHESDGKRSD